MTIATLVDRLAVRVSVFVVLGLAASCTSPQRAQAADLIELPGVDSISSDYRTPTTLLLEVGSNFVRGEVGAPGTGTLLPDGSDAGTDGDFLSFSVPLGHRLDQLFVNRYNQLQRGFAIYAPGDTFGDPIDIGGGNIFYPFADGALFFGDGDIVSRPPSPLFIGSDAPVDPADLGFNVDSLPPGDYSFLIQENQALTTEYELEFVLTPIPEPNGLCLALGSMFALFGRINQPRTARASVLAGRGLSARTSRPRLLVGHGAEQR